MKFLPLLTTLVLFTSCSSFSTKSDLRAPASFNGEIATSAQFHGLPQIDLELIDVWTSGLVAGEGKAKLAKDVRKSILEAYYYAQSTDEFLNKILILDLHHRYHSFNSYKQLAEIIFAVRKELRSRSIEDDHILRQSLILLELLGEEVLYAGNLNFPENKQIRFTYNNSTIPCLGRVGKLDKVDICQGDVFLSKGDAGSSNFITKIADYPGNFSHAAIAYVDDASKKLSMVESFIEDGVKLRSPAPDYTNNAKAKLVIYRAKSGITVGQAIQGVDQFVSKMIQLVGSNDYGELMKKSAFPYDYNMDGDDPSALACTEVVLQSYMMGGAEQTNPYPKELWSTVQEKGKDALVQQFLGLKSKFPSPSDLELNPRYEIISLSFNLEKMSRDRQLVAFIDVLMNEFIKHDDLLKKMAKYLRSFDDLTPEEMQNRLANIDQRLGTKLLSQAGVLSTLPQGMKPSQVIFFGILDNVLAPMALEYAQRFSQTQEKQFHFTSLVKLRDFTELSFKKILEDIEQKLEY